MAVVLQFVLGRDTRLPIVVNISEESAAVAMQHFAIVMDDYVSMQEDDEDPDGGSDEGVPGIGTGGSFNIN